MTFTEYIQTIKDKRISVIGIGISNTPLIKRLLSEGCCVHAHDKSTAEKLGDTAKELTELGAVLHLGDTYLDGIDGDVIFRTPGLHPNVPALERAKANGSIITSEMEVFFKVCPCRIIAITGSDGKTTTTTIISELLKTAGKTVHVGGNIGTPLLCGADEMSADDICVLELSSFQLMTMQDSPETAVITNIAPNHLDVHKDMAEYVEAKKNIMLHQTGGRLVLNLDNEITCGFKDDAKADVLFFSAKQEVQRGMYLKDGIIYSAFDGKTEEIMPSSDIFLPGAHNIENYMAAFAATYGLVSADVQRTVAKTFRGVEHRIEHVRNIDGVDYYNDSIASSPSRTMAGLRSFEDKVILIAGGKDKGVPFDELGCEINRHVKALVLTGFTAQRIYDAVTNAENYDPAMPIMVVEDFKEAIIAAKGLASCGDKVILSPACTSFDRFRNFMERGNMFKDIVNSL